MQQPRPRAYFISLLAGGITTLAFAPFNLNILALIATILLCRNFCYSTPQEGWRHGGLYGLGFYLTGVSWIYNSIIQFGTDSVLLSGLIVLLFILFLASLYAMIGFIATRWSFHSRLFTFVIYYPLLFLGHDVLLSYIFGGFPWLLPGLSQIDTPLVGYAPVLGILGVCYMLYLTAGIISTLFSDRCEVLLGNRGFLIVFFHTALLSVIWIVGYNLSTVRWTHLKSHHILNVVAVQGNVPIAEKWSISAFDDIVQKLMSLSKGHWDHSIIIWPEAAIPRTLTDQDPILKQLNQKARQEKATLITGVMLKRHQQYYNAAVALGNGKGVYLKEHLVPFGEYLPLPELFSPLVNFFQIPMSNLRAGPPNQKLLKAGRHYIATLICYESAFFDLVRRHSQFANFIVVLSDDAWFGDSLAAYQHEQINRFRAVETGRYVITATNTGITSVINPHGHIRKQLPRNQAGVMSTRIYSMTGQTPWQQYGHLPLMALVACILGIAILMRSWRFR